MLSQDLTRYTDLHRSLGFKFRIQHSLLRNFVTYAEAQGDEFVRVDRVLDWAARAPSPPQRRNRLLTVRRFALAMQAEDARHEVPAADALGHGRFDRRTPHIYRPDEIARLMRSAAQLQPAGSIRPLMYSTLFGLLAATGMRISEALALRLEDITADGLIIRQTKFQKSRLLPLHADDPAGFGPVSVSSRPAWDPRRRTACLHHRQGAFLQHRGGHLFAAGPFDSPEG